MPPLLGAPNLVSRMSLTLPRLPDARPLLLKALGTARRKVDPEAVIPPLAVTVSGLRADPALVARYREVCGFADSDALPITYPQVWATSLHLWLSTQPSFPFPLLGMVHLRNRIEQLRPLAVDGVYEVRASVGAAQRIASGISFDFVTEFVDAEGQAVYTATTTPLIRIKDPSRRSAKSAPEVPPPLLAEYEAFAAPEDIGRRYAAVSMDYNPIHLHAWSAKLFGFPRAIAHGMWSVARCAALLEPRLSAASSVLEVQYRAPLLLPSRAVLKHTAGAGSGRSFQLLAANAERVYLTGSLR